MKSEKQIFQEAIKAFSQEILKTNVTSNEKKSRKTDENQLILLDKEIENI